MVIQYSLVRSRLQLPEDALIPLTRRDESKLHDMLQRPYVEGLLCEEVFVLVLFCLAVKQSKFSKYTRGYGSRPQTRHKKVGL